MKRRDEVLVGVLLTAALVIGVLGTIWLVRGGWKSGYPLYARFPWGANLKQGQPVLLAGVNVGYVAKADLVQDGTIVVTMRVQDQYRVPEGTKATVMAVGFFGDAAIALTPARPSTTYIAEGDTVPIGTPKPGVDELMARVDSIGRSVSDVAQKFDVELVQGGGIADLRRTLASTNAFVTQLSGIAAEQSRQMSLTMQTLRRSTAAIDSVAIDSTVKNLQRSSANLAALTEDTRQTTARVNALLAKVDSGPGTVGQLLNDPGLYNDLRASVQRLDSLTADLKKNPKKYINFSVF
jgi:phospholipid/cholesterol/gamma-HCH transport system substrate-binding protein